MKQYLVFAYLFIGLNFCIFGQSDTLIGFYVNNIKSSIYDSNYVKANEYFNKLIELKKAVPNEIAFLYGKNQHHLGNYETSSKALTKYLNLTSDTGSYYYQTIEYIKLNQCIQAGYYDSKVTCDVCYGDSTVIIDCHKCQKTGLVLCDLCGGKGVTVTQNNFGTNFNTCHKCEGNKYLNCPTCNGSKKENVSCKTCVGKGWLNIKKPCKH